MSVEHETIRLSRTMPAALATVWEAFRHTPSRARWSVPEGEEQVYDVDEFGPGGRARYRCGEPGRLEFHGEVEYVQVRERELVVHTDTVRLGGDLLATALLTWTFTGDGDATTVGVINQVVSFVGPGMIEGHRNGHTKALAQLERFVAP